MGATGGGALGREFGGTSRFRTVSFLGSGSLGNVYRVDDLETGQQLALKTLPALDGDGIYHLKQEFRSVRGIRHRNLVKLYELSKAGDSYFFTMELIHGLRFTHHIWSQGGRPSPDRCLSEGALAALRRSLRQLARGIGALHQGNRIHCDVKPDNVWVTPDGRVVVLDFDMVARLQLRQAPYDREQGGGGSVDYMSPEQHWSGRALTPAADWYSVGVLLWEALTGALPFQGTDAAIIDAKEAYALPSQGGLPPGTPDDLCTLVRALLQPKPALRAGAAEILNATEEAGAPSSRIPLRNGTEGMGVHFVGRSGEIAKLQSIFTGCAEGAAALVCIEGKSGIGKTELVKSFLSSMGDRAEIFCGTCHHQESVPYKSFDNLVDALSEYLLSREEHKAIPYQPNAAALTRAFPVLGRVRALSGTDDLDDAPPQEIRRLAFRALRDLLAHLAAVQPLILWIDDLQWGDVDSDPLFRELLRPPDAPRVMLIVSYRSEDRTSSDLLQKLTALSGANEVPVHTLPLGPLSADESQELAATLLGNLTSGPRVREMLEEAAGSPFFLIELARYIAGGLDQQTPSAAGSDRLQQILRSRIGLLNPRERSVLEVVCVAGKQMVRSLVLEASGLGEGGRPEVHRLSEESLVRPIDLNGHPAIDVSHDLFRQVILADLDRDQLRRHHRRLAEALRATASPDPEAMLFHYRGAGDEEMARKYAWDAAERAMATLAFDRAAELYRSLLSSPNPTFELWQIHQKLGDALANAGRARQAGESFAAAAHELEIAPPAAESDKASQARKLRRQAAEQFLRAGDVRQGVEATHRALNAVGLEYPASSVRAWFTTLTRRAELGRRGFGHVKRSAAEVSDLDLDRIDACWSTGLGLTWIDRTRTAAFQVIGTLLALEAGEPGRVAQALASEASMLVAFGGAERRRAADVVLMDVRRLVATLDDLWLKAFLVLIEGSMAFYDARWRHAVSLCQQAEELFRKGARAAAWEVTSSQLLYLGALTYLGDLPELQRVLPNLVDDAEARGDLLAASCLSSGLPNLLWLSLDRPEEARRRADRAVEGWTKGDFQFPHYLHLLAATQIDIYLGDGQAAWGRVLRAWPSVLASFLPIVETLRITLHHLRARAALAAVNAAGNDTHRATYRIQREGLLQIAVRDGKHLSRQESAWAAPLSASIHAGIATARGQRAEAVLSLERAAQLFTDLDMALYAAAARYQRDRMSPGQGRSAGEAWMIDHGVVDPEKLATTLVPLANLR